jgi:hypothetical protein
VVPVLKALAGGALERQAVGDRVQQLLQAELLPGDLRVMARNGLPVWRYRVGWTLTLLNGSYSTSWRTSSGSPQADQADGERSQANQMTAHGEQK